MAKNEKTSKAVASNASRLLSNGGHLKKQCQATIIMLQTIIDLVDHMQGVAGSALTQAPDKKKRAK